MSDTLPAGYDAWRTWHPMHDERDTSDLCERYYEDYVEDFDPGKDGEMLTFEEWCEENEDRVEEWDREAREEARADSILDARDSGYW